MGHPVGLSPRQLRLLGSLTSLGELKGFYLAGGGAVAWHFRHRRSIDLDIFSVSKKVSLEEAREALERAAGARTVAESDVAISLRADDAAIDLVRYGYAPLEAPLSGPSGFPVAGPLDLGVMKLAAISRRGLRRDFWDLFVVATSGKNTLATLLRAYQKRYGSSAADVYHVVRSLTYFDDAEKEDPRLVGLSASAWKRIREWFEARALEVSEVGKLLAPTRAGVVPSRRTRK